MSLYIHHILLHPQRCVIARRHIVELLHRARRPSAGVPLCILLCSTLRATLWRHAKRTEARGLTPSTGADAAALLASFDPLESTP